MQSIRAATRLFIECAEIKYLCKEHLGLDVLMSLPSHALGPSVVDHEPAAVPGPAQDRPVFPDQRPYLRMGADKLLRLG